MNVKRFDLLRLYFQDGGNGGNGGYGGDPGDWSSDSSWDDGLTPGGDYEYGEGPSYWDMPDSVISNIQAYDANAAQYAGIPGAPTQAQVESGMFAPTPEERAAQDAAFAEEQAQLAAQMGGPEYNAVVSNEPDQSAIEERPDSLNDYSTENQDYMKSNLSLNLGSAGQSLGNLVKGISSLVSGSSTRTATQTGQLINSTAKPKTGIVTKVAAAGAASGGGSTAKKTTAQDTAAGKGIPIVLIGAAVILLWVFLK